MKDTAIDAKSQQMLELLAQGASSRIIAKRMGYREGTMRVYLHNLYKRIGVKGKTQAVIWYLGRTRSGGEKHAPSASVVGAATEEAFGDMALRESLYAALGVMSTFLGPYGRVWEVGVRLKGEDIDEATLARRLQSRLLWQALLAGDFAYGKELCDTDRAERLALESPSDGALLAALLLIGGYSSAADRLVTQLSSKRKGAVGATAREASMLHALRDALYANEESGLITLYNVAAEAGTNPVLNQSAMVVLFHAYRARKDVDRARGTANAIWAAAEAARQHLEAMGVRPLGRDMALPRPAKAGVREPGVVREKVAATR
jgi:DNA-binding CsgD family transcriptional regulator